MTNKDISKVFKLCGQLMELHNENSFRMRAMTTAAFRIEKLPFSAADSNLEELSEQPNIGKSTAEKIIQVVTTGTFPELDKLIEKTPEGIIEMMKIKGLGPKKVQIIWKDLEIESVGELYYACNENRLIEAKGFGLKTQEDIKKAIEFSIASQGWFLYARVKPFAEEVFIQLQKQAVNKRISFTGDYRRKMEILQEVAILIEADQADATSMVEGLKYELNVDQEHSQVRFKDANGYSFVLKASNANDFAKNLLISTGSKEHLVALSKIGEIGSLNSEEAIYQSLGLAYIEPELREGGNK